MKKFYLMDRDEIVTGEVMVSTSKEVLMLGSFVPAPRFQRYEPLFRGLEQSANDQLFVEIDRLEREIAELGFYLIGPLPQDDRVEIEDLQIMGNGVSFRPRQRR